MDESLGTWLPTTLGELTDLLSLAVVLTALLLRVLPSTRRWAPRGSNGFAAGVMSGVTPTARAGPVPAARGPRVPCHPSH